jgi:hypothetical protein
MRPGNTLFSADPVDPGQVALGAEAESGGLRGRVWREGAVLAVCGSALGWFPRRWPCRLRWPAGLTVGR